MPTLRCLLIALALVAPLLLGAAQPAAAHSELERAEPAPNTVVPTSPSSLRLWVTETVEPSLSEIVVVDANLQPVSTARAQVSPDQLSLTLDLPPLPDGSYTVTWKLTSTVDGHTTRGFYALAIGATTPVPVAPAAVEAVPAGPPVSVQATVRWLAFTGQAVVVGGLLFGLLILSPALGGAPVSAQARRRRAWLDGGALGALVLAALAAIVMQTVSAAGVSIMQVFGTPLLQVLATRYGLVWLSRVALLVVLAGAVVWMHRQATTSRWLTGVSIILGLGLLLTTSLTSHGAASREAPWLAILADWLHLVATTAWLGGLAQFVLVVPAVVTTMPKDERRAALSHMVARFSILSLVAVALLLVTGVYSALLHVDRLDALLTTDYGRALLSKLILLLPMLALGATNLLRVRPALARAGGRTRALAMRLADEAARAGRALTRTVRAEFIIGLLIVAATGVLTSVPPVRQPAPTQGILRTETVGDLGLALSITPAQPGANTMELRVTRGGRPVDEVSKALVRLTFLDQDLGETEIVLMPAGDGRYIAQVSQLGLVGQWQAELIVRRDGQDDARTAVRFPIPGNVASATGSSASPFLSLTPVGLAAIVLIGVAGVVLAVAVRLRRAVTVSGALFGSGVGALALAVYLLATSGFSATTSASPGMSNPYPPTAQSLAQGRTLYQANCQSCHGIGGKGDGPQAAALQPPPLDLTVHVGFHPDAELYRMISQGVRGTAMPPFAGLLTEEQRWHVINYVRTFDSTKQTGQRP